MPRRRSSKPPPSVGGGRFSNDDFPTAHQTQPKQQPTGGSAAAVPTPTPPRSVAALEGGKEGSGDLGGSSPAGLGGDSPLPGSGPSLPPARLNSMSVPLGASDTPTATPPLSPGRPPQGSVPPVKRKSRRPSMQMPALGTAKPVEGRRVRRSSGYGRSSIKREGGVVEGGAELSTSPSGNTPRDPSPSAQNNPSHAAGVLAEGSRSGSKPDVQLLEPPPAGRRKHPLGAPSVTATRARGPLEGLDFTQGVIMAGTLAIQAPHGKYKWWLKHFVLSEAEQALFFWTGGPDEATSLAKRISMPSVIKIAREADRRAEGSRMFVLGVTSGATLRLAAGTPREAQLWVSALHALSSSHVAVTSISRVFRGWSGRRMLLLVAGGMNANKAAARAAAVPAQTTAASKESSSQGAASSALSFLPGSPVATRRRSESATSMVPLGGELVTGDSSSSRGSAPRGLAAALHGPIAKVASYKLHPDVALVGPSVPHLVRSWAQRISLGTLSTAAHKIGCAAALAEYLFDAVVPPSRRQSTGGGRSVAMRQAWAALHADTDADVATAASPGVRNEAPPSMGSSASASGKQRMVGHSTTPAGKHASRSTGGGVEGGVDAAPEDEPVFMVTNSMQGGEAAAKSPPPATGSPGLRIVTPKYNSDSDQEVKETPEVESHACDSPVEEGQSSLDEATDEDAVSEEGGEGGVPIVDAWGMWYTEHTDDSDVWYTSEYTGEAEWDAPENTVGTAEYPWETANDEDGDTFFLNRAVAGLRAEEAEGGGDPDAIVWTEHIPESQWEEPPGWVEHALLLEKRAVTSAVEGHYEWYCVEDEDGDVFFVHIPTGNTQWEEPPAWVEHLAYQAAHGEGTGLMEAPEDESADEEEVEGDDEEGGE